MADKKISQLPASTTPLAGTEELAIVQSGVTKKSTILDGLNGLPIGSVTPMTEASVDNLKLDGNTISSTNTNGNIDLDPNGSGYVDTKSKQRITIGEGVMQELYSASTAIFTGSSVARLNVIGSDGGEAIIGYQNWVAENNHSTNSRGMSLVFGLAQSNTQTAVDKVFFTSTGDVKANGNFIVGTAGKGIDFSADGQAAGMTSELLDDYEEGNWTPTYETTGGSFTYSSQLGRYTKIGRLVYCTFTISTSSATVGSGDVVIGGLPFTIENSGNVRGGFGLGRSNGFAGNAPLGILVFENSNFVYLTFKATVNGDTAYLNASDLSTGSGNQIFGSFYYTTEA